MTNFSQDAFQKDLEIVPWDSCYIFEAAEDQFAHFLALFQDIVDEHAPLKTCNPGVSAPPWMDAPTKAMIRTKNLLHKQCKQDASLISIYKDLRRNVKKRMRHAESQYFDDMLQEYSDKPKKIWNILSNKCPFKKPKTKTKSDQQTVDKFNDFFVNVSSTVQSSLQGTIDMFRITLIEKPKGETEDAQSSVPKLQLACSTVDDIECLIANLDVSKAAGYDYISPLLLKCACPTIAPIFSRTMNACLEQNYFPNELKIAKVLLFTKRGTHQQLQIIGL